MCYMRASKATVGVRELRQNLSVYLARVRRGETLTVTEHRRVVAVLGPASRGEDVLAHLVAEGRAMPARRNPSQLPKPLRATREAPLSDLVRDLGADVI